MKLFYVFKYLCLFLALLVSGCRTQTIKFYDGPRLPDRQLATLTFFFTVDLKIDGKNVVSNPGGIVIKRQVKLLPNTYNIQWQQAGSNYSFVYKGSGVLKAQAGQRYEVKCEKQLGATRLTGTSINYKYFSSEVLDFATWIENTNTKEVLVGRKPLSLDPKLVADFNILRLSGQASYDKGDYKSAIKYFRQVLKIKPDFIIALNKLAWILATVPDPDLSNPSEAIELSKRACQLSQFQNYICLDIMAVAYASAKQFDKASQVAQKALTLAEAANDEIAAQKIYKRMQLYQFRKFGHKQFQVFGYDEDPKSNKDD